MSLPQATAVVEHDNVPVRVGDLVSGKYRVDAVLGEGGMGYLVRAEHQELNDFVALKFLRRESLGRADVIARFKDEARAAVRLRSEHVARVMDVGEHDGVPYIVMEYLKGSDLRDILNSTPLMPVTRAVEFIIEACEGLAEAHANGIVHRDVKPENLFISQRTGGTEVLKVLDFGISKIALEGRVTEIALQGGTQDVVGSPLYMAPEQIRTPELIDRRADVWSLGIVLFELLTGKHPFGETNEFTVLVANVLEKQPLSAHTLREDVPPELDEVLSRALAKCHAQRFPSTGDLALALLPFARTRARAVAMQAAKLMYDCGWLESHDDILSSLPPGSKRQQALQAELEQVGVVSSRSLPPARGDFTPLTEPSRVSSRVTAHVAMRGRRPAAVAVVVGIAVTLSVGVVGIVQRSRTEGPSSRAITTAFDALHATDDASSRHVHSTYTSVANSKGSYDTLVPAGSAGHQPPAISSTIASPTPSAAGVTADASAPKSNPGPPTQVGTASPQANPDLDIRPER